MQVHVEYLDDQRVQRHPLDFGQGEVVHLGEFLLRVEAKTDAGPSSAGSS